MRVAVINNCEQFNQLICRGIRDKVDCELVFNRTPIEEIDADGLILGGGPSLDRAGNCPDYLLGLDIPILGICLGMQIMGTAFGGWVMSGSIGIYALVDVEMLIEDGVLKGFPREIQVLGLSCRPGIRASSRFREVGHLQDLRYRGHETLQ